jgi:hypothetical protein
VEDDGSKLQRGDIIVDTVVCQKEEVRHQKVAASNFETKFSQNSSSPAFSSGVSFSSFNHSLITEITFASRFQVFMQCC